MLECRVWGRLEVDASPNLPERPSSRPARLFASDGPDGKRLHTCTDRNLQRCRTKMLSASRVHAVARMCSTPMRRQDLQAGGLPLSKRSYSAHKCIEVQRSTKRQLARKSSLQSWILNLQNKNLLLKARVRPTQSPIPRICLLSTGEHLLGAGGHVS